MTTNYTKRQTQIINESIKLIHTKGIQGLTIKNLSKSIGFTEAAIYRHFKNKDDIISSILDTFTLELNNSVQPILESNLSSLDKLHDILKKFTSKFSKNPYIVSVIFSDEIFKNKETLSDKIIYLIKQNNEFFRLIAIEGQEKKEIRDDISAEELSIVIMGSFRMVVKIWQLNKHNYSLTTRFNDFYNSLLKLITA